MSLPQKTLKSNLGEKIHPGFRPFRHSGIMVYHNYEEIGKLPITLLEMHEYSSQTTLSKENNNLFTSNKLRSISPTRSAEMVKKPDFFVVGAPKCGTTALNQYLSAHGEIFLGRKEMHYFGSDLKFGSQFYRRDEQAYLAEFEACGDATRIGESSVWYLFSRTAAQEIKAFNPEARIIIMLREPATMMYSMYHQFLCDGNEHLSTFEEALKAEDDRRAGRQLSRQNYFAQGMLYRAAARFTDQVKRYFDVFGREQVQVIIYDDFAKDTAGLYAQTLEFLGVSPGKVDPGMNFGVVNGNQSVKSTALRAFLQDPWVRGTAVRLRPLLPKAAFALLQEVGQHLNSKNLRPAKRTPFEPELRMSLQREFAPEVERLSELLGRDLTHWSQPEMLTNMAVQH